MSSIRRFPFRPQRGQVIPVAVFTMAACMALVFLLYNTAQRAIEKTRAVNAADAAAHAAATWSARHLNFMAYTNRAMVANHVAAGHITAFVSWTRYADDATDEGSAKALVRGSSLSAGAMASTIDLVRPAVVSGHEAAEARAPAILNAINSANALYTQAQSAMAASLGSDGPVTGLMQATVNRYDDEFRVNQAIGEIPQRMRGKLHTWLNTAHARRQRFTARYGVGQSGAEFSALVDAQLDANLRKWILGQRGWGTQTVSEYGDGSHSWRQRKHGGGTHTLNASDVDWSGSDRIQLSFWLEGAAFDYWTSWETAASGNASADGLIGDYDALKAHYNVAGAKDAPGDYELPFATLVSKGSRNVSERGGRVEGPRGALVLSPSDDPITATGAAEAYFDRPPACESVSHDVCTEGLSAGQDEYANLYNPFWRVRLSDYTFLLNNREPEPWD